MTPPIASKTARPVVVGTGLVSLDVVLGAERQSAPSFYAGGSCGNVLTILSFLGWHSLPVARLPGTGPGRRVRNDMRGWGVDLTYIGMRPLAAAPIIVERVRKNAHGQTSHSFSWSCPRCGSRLPSYSPVPARVVEPLLDKLPTTTVFYFDRPSRGAILLAQHLKAKGAVIFYEPSGVGEAQLFSAALDVCDVLKYSQERMKSLEGCFGASPDREYMLEVQTNGAEGLKYRGALLGSQSKRWRQLEGYPVASVRDTAGAGDWCSAGIIDRLLRQGMAELTSASDQMVEEALGFGQALGAWTCSFEGARGGMGSLTPAQLESEAARIRAAQPPETPLLGFDEFVNRHRAAARVCLSCRTGGTKGHASQQRGRRSRTG